MAMDEKGLGQRLQAARLRAGMTQQVLCQKADLSYSTLTKIERGAIKSPSIFTIQHIATALGVGLDELLGVKDIPTSAHSVKKYRSKNGVQFVYFDINGCLVRYFHRAFTDISIKTGVSVETVETAFWHYNDQVCRGDMTMDAFNAYLNQQFGADDLDWTDFYMQAIEPIKAMQAVVTWAAEHYRIGLLTNIMPGFIDIMRRENILPDVTYDTIIDSSEVGAIKPEARIFEVAATEAHCPSSDILLIDDDRTNLMAAERQGWRVLWFDDYRAAESAQKVREALELA